MYAIAAKYGVVMGLLAILFNFGIYFADPTMFASFSLVFINLAISIASLFVFANIAKNENGGHFTYAQAFLTLLIMITISTIVDNSFKYLLYNVIDPTLSEVIKKQLIENMSTMFQSMNIRGEELDKALEQIEQQDTSFTPKSVFISIGSTISVGAIFSLLAGLAIKNRRG